jgi:hypothetical protein
MSRPTFKRLTRKYHASVSTAAKTTVYDGPGVIGDFTVSNPNTDEVWIQFFDSLAAGVTVGSTTPDLSYPCPPGDGTNSETSPVFPSGAQVQFDTGMTFAITTTRTGSTAAAAAVTINGLYRRG